MTNTLKHINHNSLDMNIFYPLLSSIFDRAARETKANHLCPQAKAREKAIGKAGDTLLQGIPFSMWVREDGVVEEFSIGSASEPWKLYSPDSETCQCKAFQNGGKYCWHRAAYEVLAAYAVVDAKQEALQKALSSYGVSMKSRYIDAGNDLNNARVGMAELVESLTAFTQAPQVKDALDRMRQQLKKVVDEARAKQAEEESKRDVYENERRSQDYHDTTKEAAQYAKAAGL